MENVWETEAHYQKKNLESNWTRVFFATFTADQSDLLQLVEPVCNSSMIPIGVSGDVG